LYDVWNVMQILSTGAAVARCDLAFAANLAPLALGHGTPDPELLARNDRELKALGSHRAFAANLFRCARGCTTLGEEKVRVCSAAIGEILPGHVYAISLQGFYEVWEHVNSVDVVITIM